MAASTPDRSQALSRRACSVCRYLAFVFSLVLLAPPCVQAALEMTCGADALTLRADRAELAQVLAEISRQAKIDIIVHGAIQSEVTLEMQDASIDRVLRRLLKDFNFAFEYERVAALSGAAPIRLKRVAAYGRDQTGEPLRFLAAPGPPGEVRPVAGPAPESAAAPLLPPIDQSPDKDAVPVGKGVFLKIDREHLAGLVAGDLPAHGATRVAPLRFGHIGNRRLGSDLEDGQAASGVEVVAISPGSAFEALGLAPGDIIQDINGTQTATPELVAEALQRGLGEENGGMLRIEVERGEVVEPVYVELGQQQP